MEVRLNNVDLNKYKDFVEKVTSLQSNETGGLTSQLEKLEKDSGVNKEHNQNTIIIAETVKKYLDGKS